MIWIGIDPGVAGAIAFLTNGADAAVFDYTHEDAIVFLREVAESGEDAKAMIEKQWSRKSDSTRVGVLLQNYGEWIGRLDAFQIPYEVVAARTWQKAMLPDNGVAIKTNSLQTANKKFPRISESLSLVKHHNRADALLIAAYCKRKHKK